MVSDLLVGVLAGLHAALLQRVVVVEQAHKQVPQHPGVVQVRLQEEVHGKGADALDRQRCRPRKTLRGGEVEDSREGDTMRGRMTEWVERERERFPLKRPLLNVIKVKASRISDETGAGSVTLP